MSKLLDGLESLLGPLDLEHRAALTSYLGEPTEAGWDAIHGVVVSARPLRTVWQAVLRIDPTFPRVGPASAGGKRLEGWTRIPDAITVARALRAVAS